MNQYIPILASFAGAGLASYMGVKVALARLEEQIKALERRITSIEKEIGDRKSGIRGALHELPDTFMKVNDRLTKLENRE